MNKQIFLSAAILSVFMQAAHANPISRHAAITGGGGNGRCTIEVSVDHAAEVEVSGDLGLLTTTGGQQADWRRFQCNAPLPRNPVDFRFIRVAGRGAARLVQDPRQHWRQSRNSNQRPARRTRRLYLRSSMAGNGGWRLDP